jgi:plastocyanin
MKKTINFFLLILAIPSISFSTTHTITNSGFSFSPSSITINSGDTVKFVLASMHSAREVEQSTWDANGTTSNGGFDLPLGGGIAVLTQAGIHYYVCVPHASQGMKGTITVNPSTDVKTISKAIPNNFILKQNYPNPFNPSTKISFSIREAGFVSLKIFNILGKEVTTLINENLPLGNFNVEWYAINEESGIYFYTFQTENYLLTKKMILLK